MIDDKKIAELRSLHGDNLHLIAIPDMGFEGVFRGPDQVLWRKLRVEADNAATQFTADQNFAVACLVHPGHEELSALANRYPAIYQKISTRLGVIGGAAAEVVVKKL